MKNEQNIYKNESIANLDLAKKKLSSLLSNVRKDK